MPVFFRRVAPLFLLLALLTLCACGLSANGPAGASVTPSFSNAVDPAISASHQLSIHYIDVGQGDAALLQLPGGKTCLIDAGPGSRKEALLDYLDEAGVTYIDYLIATHPHEDHIGGMQAALERYDVGTIVMPRVNHTTKVYTNLLETIRAQGKTVVTAKAGVTLFSEGGAEAVLLSPTGETYSDLNAYSAVLQLTYGSTSFLFMGDLPEAQEKTLSGLKHCDVLKVGHHGSRTSTGEALLSAVTPVNAVISLGEGNSYGHPHQEALQRLQNAGAIVWRTDEDGTITVVTTGDQVSIKTVR